VAELWRAVNVDSLRSDVDSGMREVLTEAAQ